MYKIIKRISDILISAVGLTAGSPVFAVTALCVYLSMGRPVLFRQERPGKDGIRFTLVKFRTMRTGGGTDAERLTQVGRVLRALSLDELPQLWNVLKGEMSLVGPRPLLPEYLALYTPRQALRHTVKPGITGLAQVNGRNAASWEQRLEYDAFYAEHLCAGLDLRILCKTVWNVLKREGIESQSGVPMEPLGDYLARTAEEELQSVGKT
ncbi:MAG: sugar transferase [Oscillospiraceae bacterium]|jgi:lipopolysaccharide/colanic/teichoic acid biosynthesis glycosyltransferase|nr:sugar transferase [Oscillospiraceae bacterium]